MTTVNQRFIIKILFLVLFLSISVRASEGFAEINGTRLHYEIKGKGHTIVLIHGGLADSRLWDDQFTKFSKNFRVIRYDLRGFGKSDFPVGAFSHVEDLYALLKFLKVEKVSLVGLSLGGIIAADFTLEHPETVEALVLTAFGKTSEAARLFCASMPTKKAYLPPSVTTSKRGIRRLLFIPTPQVNHWQNFTPMKFTNSCKAVLAELRRAVRKLSSAREKLNQNAGESMDSVN
jgi:pimeloyl-ACP methyl ester carboxylesterase